MRWSNYINLRKYDKNCTTMNKMLLRWQLNEVSSLNEMSKCLYPTENKWLKTFKLPLIQRAIN